MKQTIRKDIHNKYRGIIIERLNQNTNSQNKNNSRIHSLKTQCTPNQKSLDMCERFFEYMNLNFAVKYKPVPVQPKPKSTVRCLYTELIQLSQINSKKQTCESSGLKKYKPKFKTESSKSQKQIEVVNRKSFKKPLFGQKQHSKLNYSSTKDGFNKPIKRQNSLINLYKPPSNQLKKSDSSQKLKTKEIKKCQIDHNFQKYSSKSIREKVKKNPIQK